MIPGFILRITLKTLSLPPTKETLRRGSTQNLPSHNAVVRAHPEGNGGDVILHGPRRMYVRKMTPTLQLRKGYSLLTETNICVQEGRGSGSGRDEACRRGPYPA